MTDIQKKPLSSHAEACGKPGPELVWAAHGSTVRSSSVPWLYKQVRQGVTARFNSRDCCSPDAWQSLHRREADCPCPAPASSAHPRTATITYDNEGGSADSLAQWVLSHCLVLASILRGDAGDDEGAHTQHVSAVGCLVSFQALAILEPGDVGPG